MNGPWGQLVAGGGFDAQVLGYLEDLTADQTRTFGKCRIVGEIALQRQTEAERGL